MPSESRWCVVGRLGSIRLALLAIDPAYGSTFTDLCRQGNLNAPVSVSCSFAILNPSTPLYVDDSSAFNAIVSINGQSRYKTSLRRPFHIEQKEERGTFYDIQVTSLH